MGKKKRGNKNKEEKTEEPSSEGTSHRRQSLEREAPTPVAATVQQQPQQSAWGQKKGQGAAQQQQSQVPPPGLPQQQPRQSPEHQVSTSVAGNVQQQPQQSARGKKKGQGAAQQQSQGPPPGLPQQQPRQSPEHQVSTSVAGNVQQQPQQSAWGQKKGQGAAQQQQQSQGLPPGFPQQQPHGAVEQQRLGDGQGMGSQPRAAQAHTQQQPQRGPPQGQRIPQQPAPGVAQQPQRGPPQGRGIPQQQQPPGDYQQQRQQPAHGVAQQPQRGPPQGRGIPQQQQPPGGYQQQRQQPAPGVAQQQPPRGVVQQQPIGDGSHQRSQQQQQGPSHEQSVTDLSKKMDMILINEKISKCGTLGRKIPVFTNHFELKLGRVKQVIHYDVDIKPDTPKKLLKIAFIHFKAAYFPKNNPAFDGRKNAYSAVRLPFGSAISGKVIVEEEGIRPKEFEIKIQEVNVVNLDVIDQYLRQANQNHIMDAPMDALQAIDIVFRHSQMMRRIQVGKSFFSQPSPQHMVDLGNGMEMYRGIFQSVSLGWKTFLNVDVANKAFPKCQPVVSLISELCNRSDPRRGLEMMHEETFARYIRGLRVEYNLPNKPSMKKRTRVNGIGPAADSNSFDYKNDNGQVKRVTVLEYYRMVYGIQLQYPKLPCLWVGALQKEQKTYLPCEFCTVLPGQAVQRKLDANQTRNMIRQCATNTATRKDNIERLLREANYNVDSTVNEFDLKVSNDFLRLDARVLNPPSIQYNQRAVPVRRGVWNAMNFLEGKVVDNWTILNLDGRTKQEALEKLASFLLKESYNVGMQMKPPTKPFREIRSFRNNRLSDDLNSYFKSMEKMQIIFVVIPDGDKTYNFVKQSAELAVGCLTQCLTAGTVFKKLNPATIGNILLKVNAKLNGANHTLQKRPNIMSTPVMIMGADVTHPSPDATSIPSVAAVTASHCIRAFKYNICWRLQPPTVEVISDMENITLEHLRYFQQINKIWPKKIIFYRDGVSDGQFRQVLHSELLAIRRACGRINEKYKPSITFIVVQKRHHTRFFPADPRDSEDKNCNVPAGTCVDTEIVHPTRQNFFLVSHASIQGVAKPTKYVTLWDDNDFSNDDLQAFTYELCHMFARCTRSVSYPAPTYYAHLAAARAKVYIETMNLNMQDLAREQQRFQIKDQIIKGTPMFFV